MLPLSFTGFLHNNESPFISKILCTLKKYLLLTVFLPVVFIAACKDENIISAKIEIPVVDSNFFTWRYYPVDGHNFYDTYVADTDKVFYVLDGNVFYFNGNTSAQIYNNIEGEALSIDGLNSNQVYIGGHNNYQPWLKKWNGVSLENITVLNDSNQQIVDVCIQNEYSIWFAGISGRIYNYNGISVTPFFINIPFSFPKLFLKDYQIYYYTSTHPNNNTVGYIYKFINSSWQLINVDTGNYSLVYAGIDLINIGNHIIKKTPTGLKQFNVNNWVHLINTPGFEAYSVNGNDLNDFLCFGIPSGTLEFIPYYFNGVSWFKQNRVIPENIFFGFPVDLKYCNGTYIGFYYAIETINNNYIAIGKMNTPPGK